MKKELKDLEAFVRLYQVGDLVRNEERNLDQNAVTQTIVKAMVALERLKAEDANYANANTESK